MYLARLPVGAEQPQIYEVDRPVIESRNSEPFYTPRAWIYRSSNGASAGIAALDSTPIKAAKRLAARQVIAEEIRRLTQRPVASTLNYIN